MISLIYFKFIRKREKEIEELKRKYL